MSDIQVTKKTSHKTEQIELAIKILCFLNDIHLSDTERRVLAYYVVHGLKKSTDKLINDSGISKPGALSNIKVTLKRLGFLKRTSELYNSYELALDESFTVNSDVIKILIKLDNS